METTDVDVAARDGLQKLGYKQEMTRVCLDCIIYMKLTHSPPRLADLFTFCSVGKIGVCIVRQLKLHSDSGLDFLLVC